jgi:hypothetical protein
VGDLEAADGVLGILPSTITEDTGNTFQEAANTDDYGTLWNYSSQRNVIDGELHFVLLFVCYDVY